MNDYIAVGNDELSDVTVKKGDIIVKGSMRGELRYGTDIDGNEVDTIGFITIDGKSYLVAVNNKLMPGCHKEE